MELTSGLINKIAELYYTNFWQETGYKNWNKIENPSTYRTVALQVLSCLNEYNKKEKPSAEKN